MLTACLTNLAGPVLTRRLGPRAMERHDEALADFSRAIELDPSDDDYAVKLAEIRLLTTGRKAAMPEASDAELPS